MVLIYITKAVQNNYRSDMANLSERPCDRLEEQLHRSYPASNLSFATTSGEFRQGAKLFKNHIAYLSSKDP